MSIAAEKVAEVLALPEEDRAFLARQLKWLLGTYTSRFNRKHTGHAICEPWSKAEPDPANVK
jgi:hypothetical protein